MFDKIKQWAKDLWTKSWSRLWGHIQLWGGSIAAGFGVLGEMLNDSSVKNAVDALHLDPKVMLGLAMAGAVTLIARSHN